MEGDQGSQNSNTDIAASPGVTKLPRELLERPLRLTAHFESVGMQRDTQLLDCSVGAGLDFDPRSIPFSAAGRGGVLVVQRRPTCNSREGAFDDGELAVRSEAAENRRTRRQQRCQDGFSSHQSCGEQYV